MKHYILGPNGNPVYEPDETKWDQWFSHALANSQHIVCKDFVGHMEISTVFVGHCPEDAEPPALWETRIFRGTLDQVTDKCPGSREAAEAMHERMVCRVEKMYDRTRDPKPQPPTTETT